MEKMENVKDAISYIKEKVDFIADSKTIPAYKKYFYLGHIYLEARDYKSNGYLSDLKIHEIIAYDERAIGYAHKRMMEWKDVK